MKTGLTNRTSESLQLNAGVFLTSYTKGGAISSENIIGATRGGGTFSAVPTIRQVAVDGAPTYVKGLEIIDDWVVTLSVANFIEFTENALKIALGGGASATTNTAGDTVIKVTREIASTDFKDIYWVGDTSAGENIVIHIKNSMNLAGLTATFNERGEGTYPVTLTAHYAYDSSDASWAEEAPFEIILEQ